MLEFLSYLCLLDLLPCRSLDILNFCYFLEMQFYGLIQSYYPSYLFLLGLLSCRYFELLFTFRGAILWSHLIILST